jgi:hypothetical protein
MRAYLALVFALAPRLGFLVLWFLSRDGLSRIFSAWIWPLLGVIVLPCTTLVYTLTGIGYGGLGGSDWLWLGVGLAIDIAVYSGAVYFRVKRDRAINLLDWIEQSTAFRALLGLVMVAFGVLWAFGIFVGAMGAGSGRMTLRGSWETLAPVFLFYLAMGFVFCIVDLTRPWLPGLLPSAAPILAMSLALFSLVTSGFWIAFVAATAGAASLGAYLGGRLLKRGEAQEALAFQQQPET